ncbi:DUF2339 domain-containing protein [Polaromonas sp.]|uniref:DUF2339 domain-containing protein n=1 Tax=Polaromonas sp. TaxID=1869339 RepID=UPI003264B689
MWIVGAIVGLALGAMMNSGMLALALAAAGAWIFPKLFGKTSPELARATPKTQPGTFPAEEPEAPAEEDGPPVDVRRLQRRVTELELRIQILERRAAPDSVSAAAAAAAPSEASPAPAAEAQPAAVRPMAASLSVPAPVPPAGVDRPVPVRPSSIATADNTGFADTSPSPLNAETDSPAPAPRRQRPPPPPPSLPWRERLPAPVAALIFGGNTLVKLGVLILFLGLAFLLRYTAERVTVPVELRYAAVALVGAGLLALGWLLRRKRADYALILQGAGIGVFYLTTLAAMKVSGLLPATAGFAFLFAVAVLAAALAVLQNAPMLAIVAVVEGFAAPVLASTGQNRPVGLFTYLLVLDIGIVLMAWFRAWRVLNLIGFVATFTLAAAWAQRNYTDDQFGVVQPFLIVFFVLFTAIGLLFARRTLADTSPDTAQPLASRAADTLRRVGRVDSALVFGVPMAAFGMQYLLMRPWEFGAAFSALGLGVIYLLLGRIVFATQPRGLALLAEAYAIVGVIFGTLAIPLGLEGQWTGAAWAVEAAGMYWLGARQARPYARAFSFLVLLGAAFKLLQDTRLDGALDHALLQGSTIGPLLLAVGAFSMWTMHGRSKLDQDKNWEALAGIALPWLAMAALTLLQWQWWTPPWAAAATAVLASVAFIIATRFDLRPLPSVSYGMQALAVAGFVATLHRGDADKALASGWQGAAVGGLIALSILGTTAWTMARARRAALARGLAPDWSLANIAAVLTGTGLLHLAMLFQLSLQQAALVWPLSALVVLWVALRMAHAPLAALAAGLHVVSGVLLLVFTPRHTGVLPAFAHMGFWTAVVLGLSALLAGAWIQEEARPRTEEARTRRWVNSWCAQGLWLWAPVVIGLWWWLVALLVESINVLQRHGFTAQVAAACIAIVVGTSLLCLMVARRRDWSQLGRATLATLPGLAAIAALAGLGSHTMFYVPSSGLGWLAWPLAALWHLPLLRGQQQWVSARGLQRVHIAGFWFFLLLAARECQWQFASLGDAWSSWALLGWVIVPALSLWALRSQALLKRWPLASYRSAYLETVALPVALYLLAWAWVTNAGSAGNASPLPYIPLLNPLELGNWLVLLALLLWWRELPEASAVRVPPRVAQGIAGITALALLTGMVLRACHHYAGVPWDFDALWASRLTQAALSITWALCGVLAMVLGHGRALRPLWMVGAALLGVVVLKLFFVELADRGGLFRIVSFIGVGALLLLVGYFAPVPPAKQDAAIREGEGA